MGGIKGKPGRPKAIDPRAHQVAVRLTSAEVAALDAARGHLSRSNYLRALLARDHADRSR